VVMIMVVRTLPFLAILEYQINPHTNSLSSLMISNSEAEEVTSTVENFSTILFQVSTKSPSCLSFANNPIVSPYTSIIITPPCDDIIIIITTIITTIITISMMYVQSKIKMDISIETS
jgi:hypothetical protein